MTRKLLALPALLFAIAACGTTVDFVSNKASQAAGTWYCTGQRALEAAVDLDGSAVLRDPEYGYGVKFLYEFKDGKLSITYKSAGSTEAVKSVLSLANLEKKGVVSAEKNRDNTPGVVSLGSSESFKVKFVSDTEVHFTSSGKGSKPAKCYKDSETLDFKESSPSVTAALTVNSHILARAERDKSSVFAAITKIGKEDATFLNDFAIKVGGSSGATAWPTPSKDVPEQERLLQITDTSSGVSVCIELGTEPTVKSPRRMGGWSLIREVEGSPACSGAIATGLTADKDW
jgi:hypothetical protein